jgi:hypothetical protein
MQKKLLQMFDLNHLKMTIYTAAIVHLNEQTTFMSHQRI